MPEGALQRFQNQVVLVTGAAQGIGRALALAFAREGADIGVNDQTQAAGEAVAEILDSGRRAVSAVGDVGDPDGATAAVEATVGAFGRVDVLVNNAGIYPNTPLLELPVAEWDEVLRVNLRAAFLMSQAVARAMIARRIPGRIVNIASTAAWSARVGAAHYCASKAGLVMLTRVLALELGPHEIRVNAVAPGYVRPPAAPPEPDAYASAVLAMTPRGRLGEVQDVVEAVLFVCSEDADFMTGETLRIDGGFLAGRPLPAGGSDAGERAR